MNDHSINDTLAILGGPRLINNIFSHYDSLGVEEAKAAQDVIETGVLSRFLVRGLQTSSVALKCRNLSVNVKVILRLSTP